jgi:heme exporter protein D
MACLGEVAITILWLVLGFLGVGALWMARRIHRDVGEALARRDKREKAADEGEQ